MKIINSMFSAFLMYSRIPMPNVEWKEENRRYSLCFFPLIGVITGVLLILWNYVAGLLSVNTLLYSVVSVVIPIAVTGGIHLDGFCDVSDAAFSYADKKRKLEIMSDPHIGSFAVISIAVILLIQTGAYSEITDFRYVVIASLGFVLSRSLSGLAAVTFKNAKSEGALQNFSRPAHKKVTVSVLMIIAAVTICAMIYSDVIVGISSVVGAMLTFTIYRLYSYRVFGGITGDLAGWFLVVCETVIPCSVALSGLITEAVL